MAMPSNPPRPSVVLDHDGTLVVVIEMSLKSWLAALVPGLDRRPLQKLAPDQDALLRLLGRWRTEGLRAGAGIDRIAVACAAGSNGAATP